MGGGRPSGFIDFPNLNLGPLELGDRVFCPGVPHLHHPPGGGIPGLDLQGRHTVGLDPVLGARVGHVDDERPTWRKVLAETSQRPDLVFRRLAVGEAVESADHPRIAARQRELSHVGYDRPLAPASPPGLGPEALDHRPAQVEPICVRPRLEQAQEDTAGPAAGLEHRAVRIARDFKPEWEVKVERLE